MRTYTLDLFSGFRLRAPDGRVIGVTDRRARFLIAYVAVAGRAVARLELGELLCPDCDEADLRAALRQSLYIARKAAASPDLIVADGEGLRLNGDLVDVDLWRFRAAVDRGDPASLAEAVGLYRGPLLAGMPTPSADAENRLAPHRSAAEDRALWAALTLAAAEEAAGRHEASLALARRAVEIDPLREDAHRQAMRVCARMGQRTAALRQYRACRELLERELGVAPEPETVALAERIARAEAVEGTAAATAADAVPAGARGTAAAPPRVRVAAEGGDDPRGNRPLHSLVDDLGVALCEYRWFDVVEAAAPDASEGPAERDYILRASLRRADGAARLTVRLRSSANGRHLLAEQLDLPETVAALLPDEEVGRLAARVEQALRTAEIGSLCGAGARPRSAYEHLIHAYRHLQVFRPDDNRAAQALLREALRLDPRSGHACGLLLWTYWLDIAFHWRDARDALAEVVGPAEDALALDPGEPFLRIHLASSRILLERDFKSGFRVMRETLGLNPHLPIGWGWLGWIEIYAGEAEPGIGHLSKALRLNPESPFNFLWEAALGMAHFLLRRPTASMAWLRRSRHARPNYPIARSYLVANLAEAGRGEEARAELAALMELCPCWSAAYLRGIAPYRVEADRERYIAALLRAGLPEG